LFPTNVPRAEKKKKKSGAQKSTGEKRALIAKSENLKKKKNKEHTRTRKGGLFNSKKTWTTWKAPRKITVVRGEKGGLPLGGLVVKLLLRGGKESQNLSSRTARRKKESPSQNVPKGGGARGGKR